MPHVRVAIIGAGVSGLATARALRALGFEVVVFERAPDLGGVWSRTRSYPGVSTQDDQRSYAYSDLPMPADYAEHPSGAQVRAYLEDYARTNDLTGAIRLRTDVVAAEPLPDDLGWTVESSGPEGRRREVVDFLVAANGVYCEPHIPPWPGREEFEAVGGRLLTPSEVGDGTAFVDARAVVVGWGKTACDLAAEGSARSRSTTVVARELRWKIPKRIGTRLTFRHLLLTRLGEHLLATPRRSLLARLLAAGTRIPRTAVTRRLTRVVSRQLDLETLGLLPRVPLSDTNSLVTEGFFEAVAKGRIDVLRDRFVLALRAVDGVPTVELSDGSLLPADVVVAATGYEQVLDFLDRPSRERLLGSGGALRLYRKILPTNLPRLAFIGWSQSYRSPLLAEVQAVWLAAHLLGQLDLPDPQTREAHAAVYHLTHQQAAVAGAPQLPSGSFGELDELLEDLELPLPVGTRLRQLVVPLDPASYAYLLPGLRARLPQLPETHPVVPPEGALNPS
jgi:dimethylaniline monooxygenase (N-oxide forming)